MTLGEKQGDTLLHGIKIDLECITIVRKLVLNDVWVSIWNIDMRLTTNILSNARGIESLNKHY